MPDHEKFMHYCLMLAKQAKGYTKTNPMVGCVIVHNENIIAEGYHQQFGEAHAEVNAFAQIKDKSVLKDCTVYVNLEPCSHQGKTPACCLLFEQHPCKTLVVGMKDPNTLVAGRGIERIKNCGTEVILGICEQECKDLNRHFIKSIISKRPYTIAKWAQSKDGFIAKKNERTTISNDKVNTLTQKWRNEIDCYLIGKNTLLIDNPKLTVRDFMGKNPARAVIGDIDNQNFTFFDNNAEVLCFSHQTKNETNPNHIQHFQFTELTDLVHTLYDKNMGSLMIEGGSKTIQSFINAGLVDEIRCITNNELSLNDGIKSPTFNEFELQKKDIILNNSIAYFLKK